MGSVGLAACGGTGDRAPAVQVAIDSSGAYPVVRSTGTAPEWTTELVATVGADSGETWFGNIRSMVLDRTGRLFVVDASNVQVSAFDSLGTPIREIGRKGRGPGEYAQPYSVAMLQDSLVLLDPGGRKILLFDPKGEWVRDRPSTPLTGPQVVRLYRGLADGFWDLAYVRDPMRPGEAFVRHTSAGEVDTVAVRKPYLPENKSGALCNISGGIAWYEVPFGAEGVTVPLPSSEQAVAFTGAYRIWFLSRTGDTTRAIDRSLQPASVADADWERELVKYRAWRQRLVGAQCLRETMPRPAHRPIIDWMVVDDRGRLWVEVRDADGHRFEVFTTDGVLLARVTGLPGTHGVDPSITNGRIALYVPDENDIPRVQVFRIKERE